MATNMPRQSRHSSNALKMKTKNIFGRVAMKRNLIIILPSVTTAMSCSFVSTPLKVQWMWKYPKKRGTMMPMMMPSQSLLKRCSMRLVFVVC